MQKLLAIVLISGALLASASAAVAAHDGSDAVGQHGYWIDQQGMPLMPNAQAQ